ncbi:MAG: response regulator transcription factor, partial [Defluviitaleaceae bacterium]|nr:response regulator transcription factor [Defluviitaleaceae bacterium]
IYVVEDDDDTRELVCYALKSSGFDASGFDSAKPFRKKMAEAIPQLILLDVMLPDEDGVSILKTIKRNSASKNVPVIMLTAKAAEYDKVVGLDSGADDYIVKPFSVLELLSRIRAVMRRTGAAATERGSSLESGGIILDANRHYVSACGIEVDLTFKEFELLYFLMRNKSVAMTREKILSEVWGYDFAGSTNRTVDMHIKELRKKLGDCGGMIKTIRGLGYKFI